MEESAYEKPMGKKMISKYQDSLNMTKVNWKYDFFSNGGKHRKYNSALVFTQVPP